MTSMVLQHGISLMFQRAAGIAGCDQKTNAVTHCQVIEVISQERGVLPTYPQPLLQLSQRRWFVLDAHQAVLDVQLRSARLGGPAPAATEESQLQTGFLEQAQAKTIAHIESFLQLALRIDPEPAISQHSVDIHYQQFKRRKAVVLPLPVPFTQQSSHWGLLKSGQAGLHQVMQAQQTTQQVMFVDHRQH